MDRPRLDPTAGDATSSPPGKSIRSLIPARIDRLGWSRFHTRLVMALGVAWVLDGLEITIASNVTSLISSKQSLNLSSAGVVLRRRDRLPPRRGGRGAVLRPPVRQVGSPQPVHDHPRGLPVRRGPDRRSPSGTVTSWVVLALRVPVHRRHGHRRRVRGHQLGHRRADPGQVPGPGRHRRQRHLLGRRPARPRC